MSDYNKTILKGSKPPEPTCISFLFDVCRNCGPNQRCRKILCCHTHAKLKGIQTGVMHSLFAGFQFLELDFASTHVLYWGFENQL